MRVGRSIVAWLAMGVASAACAQDSGAPLSNTKQQLQTLGKEQSAQKAGTNVDLGLRNALPGINAPAPAIDLLPPKPSTSESERSDARKAREQRNWLLDGYDKLDRKRGGSQSGGKGHGTEEDAQGAEQLDPKDPDYFLRVYEKQRAELVAKQQEQQLRAGESARTSGSMANEPFAPFMKEWLAGSPVRDVLRDALGSPRGSATSARGNDAGLPDGAAMQARGNALPATAGAIDDSVARRTATASENPFLQALGLPVRNDPRPGELRSAAPEPVALPRAAASELGLPERPKTDPAFRPPPSPADDKKYFPQLRKF